VGYSIRLGGTNIVALTISADRSYFPEIDALVSAPADVTHKYVADASQLNDALRNHTIDLMCNNWNECDSSPCYGNATCSDSYGTFKCACPAALAGKTCDASCLNLADVLFVLDVSGSIGTFVSNYGLLLRSIIINFNLHSRVGVLVYSDRPTPVFSVGA
jgi:hypothetical protein